jgi:RNA polymerase sigma-70 factor (ECF subfamily)
MRELMDLPSTNDPRLDTILSDEEVVRRVVAGEPELFELLMRRHNQRLFRAVRGIVGDASAAEEALHRAYVAAWRALAQFDGRARFTTWMTRIALRSASELVRREQRTREVAEASFDQRSGTLEAEPDDESLSRKELAAMLEQAIDALPESLRMVVVLRLVQGLSTTEVAEALDVSEANVKVRLHRAREKLKEDLFHVAEREGLFERTWEFDGERCDRMVKRVMSAIRALEPWFRARPLA